jgi:hypothetical protein
MRPPRRYLIALLLVALVAIGIGTAAVVVGSRIRAKAEHRMAIFTIHEIVPISGQTLHLKYDVEVLGDNVKAGLAKRDGSASFVYMEADCGDLAFLEVLGLPAPVGRKASDGEGSFTIGDCSPSLTTHAPVRVELKPGESYVLATCRDKTGAVAELYLFCERL